MVLARHRVLTLPNEGGTIEYLPTHEVTPRTVSTGWANMDDTIGGYPAPYPMFAERFTLQPGLVSGAPTVFPVYKMVNYPWDNQGVEASHCLDSALPPQPSVASAVTDVVARTNPSRPEVSVPNFLFELKDIPEMLHLKGTSHSRKHVSNSAVEQNFGWDLLFQDLRRLTDFTSQVDKRVVELKALYRKGGMKRRRTVYSGSHLDTDLTPTFQSFNCSVSGGRSRHTTCIAWVTVRWKPDYPDMPSAQDLVNKARLVVHGWDFSSSGLASVIWEAVPWSWFADYFGNLGTYLNATRNAVGAHPVDACYMKKTTSRWNTWVTSVSPGFTTRPASGVFETKSRVLSSASLTASMPFLSTRQLVTLSSIATNLSR